MSHVRVRLELHGVRLEYSGDRSFFDRLVDPFVVAAASKGSSNGVAVAPPTNGSVAPPTPPAAPARKPAEDRGFRPTTADFGLFIRQLGPEAAAPDRQVVAFAFYLWNYEKKEEFHEDEIAGCFRALGLSVPENTSELYADLTEKKRFLDSAGGGRRWRLTQKGRNYVKTRLFA